ncbi:hypothetical protein MSG28_000239 [Choristoneura fumiferana]|uniref:Uncharacterized protein n=1 Tax=Choristoneura fumiferana TaxID=7141 RepID=A0ACC0JZQ9_CHOFU|nr:hypothetical protein MSG28_000239 [Choristoneura fumiferana]
MLIGFFRPEGFDHVLQPVVCLRLPAHEEGNSVQAVVHAKVSTFQQLQLHWVAVERSQPEQRPGANGLVVLELHSAGELVAI